MPEGRQQPRRNVVVTQNADSDSDSETECDKRDSNSGTELSPLFDCIFIAGIYHDQEKDKYVPFTRNQFPEDVSSYLDLSPVLQNIQRWLSMTRVIIYANL